MSDQRDAYRADEPTDHELNEARQAVEAVLEDLGIGLRDPAIWLEPRGSLRDTVVETVPAQTFDARSGRPVWPWLGVAAVVIVIAGLAAFIRTDRPDWVVDLAGTTDYPSASAVVEGWNEASGSRMRISISGVDSAPVGFFYELWLSDGPLHISAGTFVDVMDVELQAAVRRTEFPRLWVTLEPIDEDESPTSVVVVDTGA